MNRLTHIQFAGVPAAAQLIPPRTPGSLLSKRLPRASRFTIVRSTEMPVDPFISWLLERVGLDSHAYRASALQRRLPACLRQLRVTSTDDARERIERDPLLLSDAIDAVLIGVTEFFRDKSVFDHLRRVSLPELVAGRGGLSVYSAGCSDGQELCSVAICLAELGVLDRSYLLGVDCRPEAIKRALRSCYPREDVVEMDSDSLERNFRLCGQNCHLNPELRRRMRWRLGDLLRRQTDESWDVILFRNVAIYLNETHATRAWTVLTSQLSVGGLLVSGKAERPPESLPLARIAPCIYRKLEM